MKSTGFSLLQALGFDEDRFKISSREVLVDIDSTPPSVVRDLTLVCELLYLAVMFLDGRIS